MKFTLPRTEVISALEGLKRTGVVLASHVTNCVAPPVELGAFKLEGEEDDDGCNGDTAGPGRREYEVVLLSLVLVREFLTKE